MGHTVAKTILVVDDDEDLRQSIAIALAEEGYNAISVDNEEKAMDFLNEEKIDLVITTLSVPRIDGMRLLGATKEKHPEADVIIMSGSENVEMAVKAIKAGAYDLQIKPIDIDKLKLSIEELLEKQIILAKDISSHHPLDSKFGLIGFVGNSEKMQKVYRTKRR